MKFRLSIYLILLLLAPVIAFSQKVFDEGIVTYAVKDAEMKQVGVYSITVKGNFVRRELKMNSGYQNVIIIDNSNNSVLSLQKINDALYAIQLDFTELQNKQKRYEGFTLVKESGTVTLGGQQANRAKITYRDGVSIPVYYTTDWRMPANSYDRLPGIEMLPLSFIINREDGTTLNFEVVTVAPRLVESALFRIPEGYKVISNAEYKQMRR